MKLVFSLLGAICLLHSVTSQCDLSQRKDGTEEKDFPNIEDESALSYQMGVQFSVPDAKQTDYYMEYYDVVNRRGRVESHQGGRNLIYIYRAESYESWNIENDECKLTNLTDTPDFFRHDETDFLYIPAESCCQEKRTIGPSAIFKIAYATWTSTTRRRKMAYMGESTELIRGMKAQYWRRCISDKAYVDYYFTTKEFENPFNLKVLKLVPLRAEFGGKRPAEMDELNRQFYDVMTFQPVISEGLEPFELPKGKNCRRGYLPDPPQIPRFSKGNMLFSAEVVYKKNKISEKSELSSYYSTLMLALDKESEHLAYYYSPWNTSKPLGTDKKKTLLDLPEYVIYDMKFEYLYKIKYETGKCDVGRTKGFQPKYVLPENGGSLTLTNPYVLFTHNELSYLTNSSERGVAVDVFEALAQGFMLDKDTLIEKAIITHSYLKPNEILDNTANVKRAPVQITLRFYRTQDIEEVLTFNFFGFTTRLLGRSRLFDVSRCFPNDDDYVWLTIGFEPDNAGETDPVKVARRLWGIRRAMMSYLTLDTPLTPVRVPIMFVYPRPSGIYVTMLILGKPTLQLDFPDQEQDKVVDTTEMQGLGDFNSCASSCLERRECWGFSLCDAICYYGSDTNKGVKERKGCTVYRRYNNHTFTMSSKELVVQNIQMQVKENELKLKVPTTDNKEIILIATSSFVSEPAEDDSYFQSMGRELNQRMRTVKVGKKLKNSDIVKNLGRLNFAQCQRLCLDFKECETVSYCLKDSVCAITSKYAEDIKDTDMEEDFQCNIVTRKYGDRYTRSPGIVLSETAAKLVKVDSAEDCAKACTKETQFNCLSFDHCNSDGETPCRLHAVHYVNAKTNEAIHKKESLCGHYSRKYSADFKRDPEKRVVGSSIPSINNMTLEECAKTCVDYGGGVCYGYDFCQDRFMLSTSCTLFDKDPSDLKGTYSPICSNYKRIELMSTSLPYTTGYAAGIGILCFLVGGAVGAAIVFIIAYVRINRR